MMDDHRIVVGGLIVLIVRVANIEVLIVVSSHQLGGLFKLQVRNRSITYLFEVCICFDCGEILPEDLVYPIAQQVDSVKLV